MKKLFLFLNIGWLCFISLTFSQEKLKVDNLFDLSLEEFLNIEIVSVTKKLEKSFTAPGTIYIITREEIERFGFLNLQNALKIVPSVYLYNPHSWIWGGQRGLVSNFSQTLLMLNGREVNNLIAQEGFISRQFATNNIERIEVVASPGSALYGANALAGVINIITKESDPDFKGIEFSLDTGSFNTLAATLIFGTMLGELNVSGSIRQFNSNEEDMLDFIRDTEEYSKGWVDNNLANNFLTDYKNPSEAMPINLHLDYKGIYAGMNYYYNKQSHGLEKLRWNYTDGEDVRNFTLLYGGLKQKLNESMNLKLEYQYVSSYLWGRYQAGLWPVSRLQSTDNFDIYQFTLPITTSTGETLSDVNSIKNYYPSLAHYLIDQEILDPGNITSSDLQKYFNHIYTNKNSRGSQRRKFDILWNWQINNNSSLDMGYVFDNIDYVGLAVTDAAFGVGSTYDIPIDLSKRDDVYESFKHGIYAQLNHTFIKNRLWLNLGTRYDYQNHYGSTVNPRIGLVWQFSENDILKLLYGEAFREPNVFELSSNPDIEPAKLRSFEAIFSHSFGESVRVGINSYRNIVTNFLGSVGALIGTGIGTIEKQYVTGSEFQFDIKTSSLLMFFNGSILLNITQDIKNDLSGEIKTIDVLSIPRQKLNLGFTYRLFDNFSTSLLYSYSGKYDALSGNNAISEPFTIDAAHDVRFTFQLADINVNNLVCDVFVTVNNLLNNKIYHANIRRSGPHVFLQEGRNIMVRISLKI